ncbi:hypothetical protein GCM10011414_14170 [Croceivirga lutea]|nr:hypothetical protein GCM10011414_14170 [Croceivirga lutea]
MLNKAITVEEKVPLLDDLSEVFIYTEPDKAKFYLDSMQKLSEKEKYNHGILRAVFGYGHYHSTLGQMDKGAAYYRKALNLSLQYNDDIYLATILKNLAIYEEHKGNYKKAIELMDSSATYQLSYGDFLRYGSAMNVIGFNYKELGNYPKAMEYFNKALQTMDTLEVKTYHKADTYRNIGYLHVERRDYEKAITAFKQANEVYENIEDHLYLATTLQDIGDVYHAQKKYDLAAENFIEGLQLAQAHDFPTVINASYSHLGNLYKEQGAISKAIPFLQKCLFENTTDISSINKAIYAYNLGHAYVLDNQLTKAESLLNESVKITDSLGITKELKQALAYRSELNTKKGNLTAALNDLKYSQQLNDSIFSIEKAKQIDELQTLYDTEKKEAEIALQQEEIKTLNQKAKVDKLTKGLYAGGMFTFLAVSGLLFFGFRQRMKKNRIAREKQEEIYKQEIAHKQKELASQTLHLVQKNTFIQELMQNLESIKNSPEKFKMEFRRIVMLLKKENASDKDWEVFKTYFSEVHNDFDQKLRTLYPDISEKEMRLATFLRMNLTTKEIAATLNVLPDSILKSKYRFKKKLGLSKDVDLVDFLKTV